MRMDIQFTDGSEIFLQYNKFEVASAKDKYKLAIDGFHGITGNPMAYSNEAHFTTK